MTQPVAEIRRTLMSLPNEMCAPTTAAKFALCETSHLRWPNCSVTPLSVPQRPVLRRGEQKVLLEFTIKSPPQRRAPQPRPADGACGERVSRFSLSASLVVTAALTSARAFRPLCAGAALGRVSFWEEMTGYAAHSHSRDSGASPGGSPADRAPADAEALADVRVDTGPAEDGAGAAEGARDGEGAEGAARAGAGSGAGMARDASGRRGVRPSAAREEWSVRRRGDFPL